MPASLLDLKKKIASVQQTGKITQAMKMVSASKLSQTEKSDQGYSLYHNKIRQTISHLMSATIVSHLRANNVSLDPDNIANVNFDDVFGKGTVSELTQGREHVKSTAYLVITGDRGLVGSYNSQVIKQMMTIFTQAQKEKRDIKILAIGSVGAQFFKKNNLNVVYEKDGISDVPTFDEIRPILSTVVKMYLNGVFDELNVCYTHHINSLSSAFKVEKMLPISDIDLDVDDAKSYEKLDYDVEPDVNTVLAALLSDFARSTIYGAILDAKTAEHASSMTAMQSASDNANDIVDNLTVKMNRARQAQITTEITEIISGANALE
jgi:F-type H+-transporting ATPase subunit gamma